MAEEIKQEENKCACGSGKALATFFKVILGLVFLGLGGLAILSWGPLLLDLIKGSIGLFLILAGIIILAIAKE